MSLGDRIRTARTSLGLTQAQVAEQCGLSPFSIYAYERGTRVPPLRSLERLSKVLKVPAMELLRALTGGD